MDNKFLARFEKLEKKVNVLERAFREADNRDNGESIIEMDLVLPEADIDGLHFNEQKVHAVFELKEDGWYHSRDILFLSARNTNDDNSKDVLTEYLSKYARKADSIKQQIAARFSEAVCNVEISLPTNNDGIKQYNGVDWWYWQKQPSSGSAASFCDIYNIGYSNILSASSVGGCAPVFRVAG